PRRHAVSSPHGAHAHERSDPDRQGQNGPRYVAGHLPLRASTRPASPFDYGECRGCLTTFRRNNPKTTAPKPLKTVFAARLGPGGGGTAMDRRRCSAWHKL